MRQFSAGSPLRLPRPYLQGRHHAQRLLQGAVAVRQLHLVAPAQLQGAKANVLALAARRATAEK